MDYKQTLDWLFSQLPMYQRIGKAAYKADLDTTIKLLDALGNPQKEFKAIHIAGTNGKGSVSHLAASVLQEGGYKTGLYTSPHLKDFRERIKINGAMIGEDEVVAFIDENKKLIDRIKPSFFEMTVAMAFDFFAKEKVDIAVLETGMGGRLDSTNVSFPVVTVITNIGMDHMQFLGDTKEKIAVEKAGIIKENVPLVIGESQNETRQVFESKAKKKSAPITFADEHFELREVQTSGEYSVSYDVWKDNQLFLDQLTSPLLGNYQAKNIVTMLQSIDVLNNTSGFQVDKESIKEGIENVVQNTGFAGRWQVLRTNPLTICDSAHNQEGLQAMVNQINDMKFENLHFILGMVNDKNPESILYILPNNGQYYFCRPDIPRGMDAEELKEKAFKAGLRGEVYGSIMSAFNSALNNAKANDLIFIGGSTFVVAEVV